MVGVRRIAYRGRVEQYIVKILQGASMNYSSYRLACVIGHAQLAVKAAPQDRSTASSQMPPNSGLLVAYTSVLGCAYCRILTWLVS